MTTITVETLDLLRKDIEQKSVSQIAVMELFADPEIRYLAENFKYLLMQINVYIDQVQDLYSLPARGIVDYLADKSLSDPEKINLLIKLAKNMAEFCPPDWKEYYTIKLDKIVNDGKAGEK